jgi:hypothetical protein
MPIKKLMKLHRYHYSINRQIFYKNPLIFLFLSFFRSLLRID